MLAARRAFGCPNEPFALHPRFDCAPRAATRRQLDLVTRSHGPPRITSRLSRGRDARVEDLGARRVGLPRPLRDLL